MMTEGHTIFANWSRVSRVDIKSAQEISGEGTR